MDEQGFRGFQAVMQVVTIVGAVIAFFVGLDRYNDEQTKLIQTRIEAERLARDREFRREILLRQLDVLAKVGDSASRIAVAVADDDSTAFDAAVRDFEQLYWGSIIIVNDPDLDRAMDNLRHEIRYFRQGLVPTDGLSAGDKVKQRVQSVASAYQRAIGKRAPEFRSLPDAEKP